MLDANFLRWSMIGGLLLIIRLSRNSVFSVLLQASTENISDWYLTNDDDDSSWFFGLLRVPLSFLYVSSIVDENDETPYDLFDCVSPFVPTTTTKVLIRFPRNSC